MSVIKGFIKADIDNSITEEWIKLQLKEADKYLGTIESLIKSIKKDLKKNSDELTRALKVGASADKIDMLSYQIFNSVSILRDMRASINGSLF